MKTLLLLILLHQLCLFDIAVACQITINGEDVTSNCCKDLQKRVAELEKVVYGMHKFNTTNGVNKNHNVTNVKSGDTHVVMPSEVQPNSKKTELVHKQKTGYVGCFNDKKERALPSKFLGSKKLTIEMCIIHCESKGYSYAGVEYYSECFCGNQYNKYGLEEDNQCNTPCLGNKRQKCGGIWKLSVYETGKVSHSKELQSVKGTTDSVTQAPSAVELQSNEIKGKKGYIGCYYDERSRALPDYVLNTKKMTIEMCVEACERKGYLYAGLEYYKECFCGNNYNKHGKASEKQCNTPCQGNNHQVCGGNWKLSVYGTGLVTKHLMSP